MENKVIFTADRFIVVDDGESEHFYSIYAKFRTPGVRTPVIQISDGRKANDRGTWTFVSSGAGLDNAKHVALALYEMQSQNLNEAIVNRQYHKSVNRTSQCFGSYAVVDSGKRGCVYSVYNIADALRRDEWRGQSTINEALDRLAHHPIGTVFTDGISFVCGGATYDHACAVANALSRL